MPGSAVPLVSLEDAKAHLRVDDGDADVMIARLCCTAEATIADFLGRPLIDPVLGWATADLVPANIMHAILLVLTDLYDDRQTPLADMTSVRSLIGRYVVVSIG